MECMRPQLVIHFSEILIVEEQPNALWEKFGHVKCKCPQRAAYWQQPHNDDRGWSCLISHVMSRLNRFWWNFTLTLALNLKLRNAGGGWSRRWCNSNEPGVKATVIWLLWTSGRNIRPSYWVRISTGKKIETQKPSGHLLHQKTIRCEEMGWNASVSFA
jgi:hypothetical protein